MERLFRLLNGTEAGVARTRAAVAGECAEGKEGWMGTDEQTRKSCSEWSLRKVQSSGDEMWLLNIEHEERSNRCPRGKRLFALKKKKKSPTQFIVISAV